MQQLTVERSELMAGWFAFIGLGPSGSGKTALVMPVSLVSAGNDEIVLMPLELLVSAAVKAWWKQRIERTLRSPASGLLKRICRRIYVDGIDRLGDPVVLLLRSTSCSTPPQKTLRLSSLQPRSC